MAEKPSPFCPKDCLFQNVPVMCDIDCQHSRDQVFKTPESIEVKTGAGWVKAKVVGRTGDSLYIEQNGNLSSVKVSSPLLR